MSTVEWSKHERMLLDALTNRVAVLAVADARRIWKGCADHASFRAAIARLVTAQLIELYEVSVRKAARSSQPILHLKGNRRPQINCEIVSRRLRARWTTSSHAIRVMTASRRSANLFGSSAYGLPLLGHREHDILLGNVFTHYVINAPESARKWIGEHALPKAGYRIKDPDAFLADQGVPYRIVESGGSYSAAQVKSLIDFAQQQDLELEVW